MRLSTLLPLLGLFAIGYAKKCPRQRTSPGKEILCYTSSKNAEELVDGICKCTTLVHQGYQLHDLSTAGIEELKKTLKEANPAIQFVISVTDPEGTLKTSATTRQEASGRLANVLSQVDGVELDMSAGSKEKLSHFLKGLKDEMIRKSNEKRIILSLPTKAEDLAKQYDLKSLAKHVDLFTLSTNYLVDKDESFKTFHPSRLMGIFDMLNTDSLVDLVSGMGVPKKKLLVSVPASAYKFTLKNEDKTVPGSSVKEEEPTVITQKELCDLMSAGEWTVERDSDLTAPYAFKDSTWIAFEDKTSVGIKGKYVLLRELAGIGIHGVENDSENDCGKTVTYEVYHSFTDMKRKTRGAVLASLENDLQHQNVPQSRNVRSSEFRIVRVVDTAGAIHAIRENTQTEFICTRQGYFVHPKSCNRFYRCVKFNQGIDDYSVFEFDCPAGLAFDERTEVCVWPGSITEGSPCPGSSEIAPVPRARFQCPARNGYYADPQNCRWFFACFDLGEPELTAYEFRCPYGLVFDEQKLICEWPWLVPNCGAPGYSRPEYGGSGYEVNFHGPNSGSIQDAISGTLGFGDYSKSGISHGSSGHYSYPGSKPSESKQSETAAGEYPGIGINGGVYTGQQGGAYGARESGYTKSGTGSGTGQFKTGNGHFGAYGNQGSGIGHIGVGNGASTHSASGGSGINQFASHGNSGFGHIGAGNGASTYSGSDASGSGHFGSHGNQDSGSGHVIQVPSGLVVGNGGHSNPGVGFYETGSGDSSVTGGHSGSEHGGSSDSGHGATNFGYESSSGSSSGHSEHNSGTTGLTGAYNGLENGGVVTETQGTTGSGHFGGTGYTGSNLAVNTAGNSGLNVFGNTGNQESGIFNQGTGTYTTSNHGTSDSQDVINDKYNSGIGIFTGGTGSVHSEQGPGAYTTSNEGTSDSQDVINDKYNSGLGILTGTTGNVFSGASGTNGNYNSGTKNTFNGLNTAFDSFGLKSPETVVPGYSVTGSSVIHDHSNDGNIGDGHVVVDHGSNYHTGFGSVTSGTGLVNNGANSYVQTGSSGTVTHNVKGGVSTGTTTYHGHGNTGFQHTDQFSQVDIENGYPGFNGNDFGMKTAHVGTGATVTNDGDSYKTSEYENTGGRGTVTFNNGYSSTKYTEGDVSRPGTSKSKDRGNVQFGITNTGISSYNSQGFTKTGPTKTGLTTAQIGGTGSYVTGGGGYSYPTPTQGNNGFGEHGSDHSSIGHDVNNLAFVTTTGSSDTSYVDTSKINLGHVSTGSVSDYQYKNPTVPFVTGGIATPTQPPSSVTYHGSEVPLTVTTPSSFLNVKVYNTPSVVTSAPITAAPAVVNTYSTVSDGYQYKKPTHQLVYPTSGNSVQQTTVYQRPTYTKNQYTVTPTPSPIAFVTNEADVYRNTLFEAAKTQVGVSTASPVYDTGYQTVISSTPSPITDTTGKYFYEDSRYKTGSNAITDQTSGHVDVSYQKPEIFNIQKEFVSSTAAPNTGTGYFYDKPTKQLTYDFGSTVTPSVTVHQRPVFTVKQHSEYVPASTVSGAGNYNENKFGSSVTEFRGYDYSKPAIKFVTPAPVTMTAGAGYNREGTDQGIYGIKTSGSVETELHGSDYSKSTAVPVPVTTSRPSYTDRGIYGEKLEGSSVTEFHGYDYSKPAIKFGTPAPVTMTAGAGYNREGTDQEIYGITTSGSVETELHGSDHSKSTAVPVPVTTSRPSYVREDNGQRMYGVKQFGSVETEFNGYEYTKPTIEFVTPAPVPVYTQHKGVFSYTDEDSSTKLIGHSNRGGVKYTPQVDLVGKTDINNQGFVNTVASQTYQSTTPASAIRTNSYSRYTSSTPQTTISDGDSSSSFRPRVPYYSSKAHEATTPASVIRTNSYSRYTSSTPQTTISDGDITPSFRPENVYPPYSSTPLYEISTVKPATGKGKGKVIVKLSDLHPLLLGKLGAQCTCRSDPFETLRGPGAKIIKSSRGDIDLKQYDESDIYVDLETDREPSQSAVVAKTPNAYPTSSSDVSYSLDLWTPAPAVSGLSSPAPTIHRSRGKPSTAYLPGASTSRLNADVRIGLSPSDINPQEKGYYESSDTLDPQFVNIPAGFVREDVPAGRSAGLKTKTGKSLGSARGSGNAIGGAGAAFDRYGPGGLRGVDETLQGGSDCARPGLFRHPKLCNKFYACHWDEWKQKYTLHVFNCPVHLSFDGKAGACNWPSKGPACQDDNLLV